MGFDERDHQTQPTRRDGLLAHIPPAVKGLLLANIVIFIVDYLVLAPFNKSEPPILLHGAFSIGSSIHKLQIWQFLSFQFIHGGLLHIMMNSMGLFFFGPWMERYFGTRRFLIYYLLCGMAGAGFYTLLSFANILHYDPNIRLVGASAGLYGILVGIAIIAPGMRVQLLFPPMNLSMRQLAIGLMILATVFNIVDMQNAGGEAGHLGGAILGLILMKIGLLNPPTLRRRRQPRPTEPDHDPKLHPRHHVHLPEDDLVDAILDKISREGFPSLTEKEREILRIASKRGD